MGGAHRSQAAEPLSVSLATHVVRAERLVSVTFSRLTNTRELGAPLIPADRRGNQGSEKERDLRLCALSPARWGLHRLMSLTYPLKNVLSSALGQASSPALGIIVNQLRNSLSQRGKHPFK